MQFKIAILTTTETLPWAVTRGETARVIRRTLANILKYVTNQVIKVYDVKVVLYPVQICREREKRRWK